MEIFTRGDVRLVYEAFGDGPAILCLAPGGLSASRMETWRRVPWNPLKELAGTYRIVAMDQRNTGTSFAPIAAGDGWGSYAEDQLALMDHLGIQTFAVVGMCIGGAFIMRLLEEAPERVTAAVALQPIGFDGNRATFLGLFDAWRREVTDQHPEARDADWSAFRSALFGADRLTWSVDDQLLPTVTQPLLVLQGDDEYHPSSVSQKLATLVPSASLIERWKDPVDAPDADAAIKEFLAVHAR
jgi:pimeloyl-ACP methyl ester carboxylesterase